MTVHPLVPISFMEFLKAALAPAFSGSQPAAYRRHGPPKRAAKRATSRPLMARIAVLLAALMPSSALEVVRGRGYSGLRDVFMDHHFATGDTLAARSSHGVGRTCALVDDGKELFCWATAGFISSLEARFDPTLRLRCEDLSVPAAPRCASRFLHVAVARDVWLVTDIGMLVVLFNGGSGGNFSMRMPTWPPLAPPLGAPRGIYSLGFIASDVPLLRVYPRALGRRGARSSCALRSDGEVQCFSMNCTTLGASTSAVNGVAPCSVAVPATCSSATLTSLNNNGANACWRLDNALFDPPLVRSAGLYPAAEWTSVNVSGASAVMSTVGPVTSVLISAMPDPGEECVPGLHPWGTNVLSPGCSARSYTFPEDVLAGTFFNYPSGENTPVQTGGLPPTTEVHMSGWSTVDWAGRQPPSFARGSYYPITIATRVSSVSAVSNPPNLRGQTPVWSLRWVPPSGISRQRYGGRMYFWDRSNNGNAVATSVPGSVGDPLYSATSTDAVSAAPHS